MWKHQKGKTVDNRLLITALLLKMLTFYSQGLTNIVINHLGTKSTPMVFSSKTTSCSCSTASSVTLAGFLPEEFLLWNLTEVGDLEDNRTVGDLEDLDNRTVEDMEEGNMAGEDFQDFFTEEEEEEGDLFPDPDTSIHYIGVDLFSRWLITIFIKPRE